MPLHFRPAQGLENPTSQAPNFQQEKRIGKNEGNTTKTVVTANPISHSYMD